MGGYFEQERETARALSLLMTGAVGVGAFITGQHEAGHLFGLFGRGQGKNGAHINVIVGSGSEIGPNGLCCFAWLTSKSVQL